MFLRIMKSLVSDLIRVNVQRNPKLIMRRFTFCSHFFIPCFIFLNEFIFYCFKSIFFFMPYSVLFVFSFILIIVFACCNECRSDSVAERMLSNWMYICLYPYLRVSKVSLDIVAFIYVIPLTF